MQRRRMVCSSSTINNRMRRSSLVEFCLVKFCVVKLSVMSRPCPWSVPPLTFIGLPFVVRTLQPAIEELDGGMEEAAMTLGAGRLQTFRQVIFPFLFPAALTGFALAFARALGEYGSVVFISGNMPMRTEISSLLIIAKLEQYDYAGATSIAVVMLVSSFVLLFAINLLQWWFSRRLGRGTA